MFKKNPTDLIQLLLIIAIALFVIEVIFIDTGLLFVLILAIVAIYFGKRSYYKTSGKTFFWGGIVAILLFLLNTFAIRLFIFIVVIYFIYQWYKGKKEQNKANHLLTDNKEQTVVEEKISQNSWFHKFRTKEESFAWQDMNVQGIIGDVVIDLNYTVLPKQEAMMLIRNVVGNVKVIVPYDVEVVIQHNVMYGAISVFEHHEEHAFNRTIEFQSKDYIESQKKIKIFTSMIVGKLEVKRG